MLMVIALSLSRSPRGDASWSMPNTGKSSCRQRQREEQQTQLVQQIDPCCLRRQVRLHVWVHLGDNSNLWELGKRLLPSRLLLQLILLPLRRCCCCWVNLQGSWALQMPDYPGHPAHTPWYIQPWQLRVSTQIRLTRSPHAPQKLRDTHLFVPNGNVAVHSCGALPPASELHLHKAAQAAATLAIISIPAHACSDGVVRSI